MIKRSVADMSSENIDNSAVISYSSSEDMWYADESCSSAGDTDEYLDSVERSDYSRRILPNDDEEDSAAQGAVGHCRCESFTGDKSAIHGGDDSDERPTGYPCPVRPLVSAGESSQIAWTDDMHHLYLNSIEEAFVKTLNNGANCYRSYFYHNTRAHRARSLPDNLERVCSRGFHEGEVESRIFGRQECHTKCAGDEGSQKYTQNCSRKRRSDQMICCAKQNVPNRKARRRRRCEHGRESEEEEEEEISIGDAISTSSIRQVKLNSECSGESSEQRLIFGIEDYQVVPSIAEAANAP